MRAAVLDGGEPKASSHELAGSIAPAFELEPIGGGAPIGPAQFAGQVVIVDFWATWCEPCRQSFPAYQRLADKYAGKLVIIGVSVDDDESGIPAFKKETGVTFPLVWTGTRVCPRRTNRRRCQPPTLRTRRA